MIVEIYECAKVIMDGRTEWYLRLKDLAPAKMKEDEKCYIYDRKYHGQTIELLNENYQQNLLVCKKTPYQFEREEWSKLDDLLKNQLSQLEFQKIVSVNGQLVLHPVLDSKTITFLKSHFNLEEEKSEIFDSMIESFKNGAGGFMLSGKQKDLLLNRRSEDEYKQKIVVPRQEFDISEIYSNVEKTVYGQKEQLKKVLATLLYNQDILSKYDDRDEVAEMKKTMLLCGSTGTGKTLMIKSIAKQLGIPYIIEDTTRYTATGYEGENVDNLLVSLASAAPNIQSAQNGIIFLDEFDKICHVDKNSNIRTQAVQEHLLKMIEGNVVRKKIRKGLMEEEFVFDTRGVTFVLAGAFQELTKDGELDEKKLISYGMLPEINGRISSVVELTTPTKEDYKNYLTLFPNSYLEKTREYLETLGVECSYDESSIDALVEDAMSFEDGYRGLKKAIDRSVDSQLFDCYANKTKKITLTKK